MLIRLFSLLLIALIALYCHSPKFGQLPEGERLKKIKNSKNYRNGQFQNDINYLSSANTRKNISPLGILKSLLSLVFSDPKAVVVPHTKTDIKALGKSEDVLVWFGHSSYFIQIDGVRILVDPVFSDISSPVPFFPKAFTGSNVYSHSDIPELDYLIITHDHWDHLDYETVTKLKFGHVICPLGVGSHLERWGIKNVIEMDWWEDSQLKEGFKVHCLPSRHFSGRGFARNKTLWASFLIESASGFKIFIGGDGGYDARFLDFGERFQQIDLAILENGQYNENWPDIHMHPNETVQAANDMGALSLFPVHNSKFFLSTHKWNDPLKAISSLSSNERFRLITPIIGEKVELKNSDQSFEKWWEER